MKRRYRVFLLFIAVLLGTAVFAVRRAVVMPGVSASRLPESWSSADLELADRLKRNLHYLAAEIGPRNVRALPSLRRTEEWISAKLLDAGCPISRQTYQVNGIEVVNLHVEIRGSTAPEKHLVVGAHYDTVDSPGANDNGSGTVALLELARRFCPQPAVRTVDLVFFVNEEAPFGLTHEMGSFVFAGHLADSHPSEVEMFSLETMGYFTEEENSQHYPFPFGLFYPTRGDFLAFVGNSDSRELLHRTMRTFREISPIPSEGVAAPSAFRDIARSDHWSFWKFGYPAIMITDTANFRYPHYHRPTDTAEKVHFEAVAAAVDALTATFAELADRP